MIKNNPNLEILIKVARQLEELRNQVVFVGGAFEIACLTSVTLPIK